MAWRATARTALGGYRWRHVARCCTWTPPAGSTAQQARQTSGGAAPTADISQPAGAFVPHVSGLRMRGVGFASLHETLDTTTPWGRLVFHVFAALAQFIRELIVQGTNEGLDAEADVLRPTSESEGHMTDLPRDSTAIRHQAGLHFGWWNDAGSLLGPSAEPKYLRPALTLPACQAVGGDAVAAARQRGHDVLRGQREASAYGPLRQRRRTFRTQPRDVWWLTVMNDESRRYFLYAEDAGGTPRLPDREPVVETRMPKAPGGEGVREGGPRLSVRATVWFRRPAPPAVPEVDRPAAQGRADRFRQVQPHAQHPSAGGGPRRPDARRHRVRRPRAGHGRLRRAGLAAHRRQAGHQDRHLRQPRHQAGHPHPASSAPTSMPITGRARAARATPWTRTSSSSVTARGTRAAP